MNSLGSRLTTTMLDIRQRPAFALYLLTLAAFPLKWLSPFSHPQAGWFDALLAIAVLAWVGGALRRRERLRLRPVHVALAGFLGCVLVSAVFAQGTRSTALENVVIAFEMAALMVLTAVHARSPGAVRAIAQVILVVVAITALEAVLSLALFYAGASSSLIQELGESDYFPDSRAFTRVSAGFYSPQLLGSFCIFASGVIAMAGTGFSSRTRHVAQAVLAALVVLTVSRAAIGFAVAMGLRAIHGRGLAREREVAVAVVVMGILVIGALKVIPLSAEPAALRSDTPSARNPQLAQGETAARTFARHPLVGAGPGALAGSHTSGDPMRAHFTPLNVAATTGLLSLGFLTAFLVLLWRERRRPPDPAIWTTLVGLGIDALWQDVEHFRHVWVMLGLADADRQPQPPSSHSPPAQDANSGDRTRG